MRIGVFDSGVGGLSVLNAIQYAVDKSHHKVSFAYCCDNKNFPYGTKTETEVIKFVLDACTRFSSEINLDVLVIACNTASTLALPTLRAHLKMPIVGVVPAIKPAAVASKTKNIGVLATPAATKGAYLESLIQEHAKDCKVLKSGSSVLVQMAEDKLRGTAISLPALEKELASVIDSAANGLDQLVLGCTHFPLLAPELKQVLPSSVSLVDSGAAIAARVIYLLNEISEDRELNRNDDLSDHQILGFCTGSSFELDLTEPLFSFSNRLMLQTLSEPSNSKI